YYLLTLFDSALLFRAVIIFHGWVAVEGVLIVLTLERNQFNVPTFIHARTLTRRARASLALRKGTRRARRAGRRGEEQRRYSPSRRRGGRQRVAKRLASLPVESAAGCPVRSAHHR